MHAESAPRFRRARRTHLLIVAAATCLLVSLVLLAVAGPLADALGLSAEPVLMAPFRWHPHSWG